MPLNISDEALQQAGLNEQDARVEFACRLFQAGRISLPAASKLANLSRVEMEQALYDRDIPAYRITLQDLQQDLETIKHLEALKKLGT